MKFEKGTREDLLWEFLHFNIYDDFNNQDGSFVDYSDQTLLDKLLSRPGKIKKDVEIIIKINGRVMPNCWKKGE